MNVSAASRQRSHTHTLLSHTSHAWGGGRSDIPDGMPQGTPEGVPAYRRPIGRRHSGAAGSGGASTWGPVFGDADGRPWLSARSGGVRCRQSAARHVVPAIAGTVWCRLVRCRRSAARFFGGTIYGRAGSLPARRWPGRGMRRRRGFPAAARHGAGRSPGTGLRRSPEASRGGAA